jgi:hypothetical protein
VCARDLACLCVCVYMCVWGGGKRGKERERERERESLKSEQLSQFQSNRALFE